MRTHATYLEVSKIIFDLLGGLMLSFQEILYIQWVKKLSQCLAISERVVCNKSNKLHKNVKIIYVIV